MTSPQDMSENIGSLLKNAANLTFLHAFSFWNNFGVSDFTFTFEKRSIQRAEHYQLYMILYFVNHRDTDSDVIYPVFGWDE